SSLGDDLSTTRLSATDVVGNKGPVPLLQVAESSLDFQPAVLRHRQRSRYVSILAEVEAGTTYEAVVARLAPKLTALELPESVHFEFGGGTEASGDANASLAAKGPFGALALMGVLLATFNSFRRVAIVMATAPLAVAGIWPGLALVGLPFGFVALLGAIALIGIVVNGAIVLIDVADRLREQGYTVAEALTSAVRLRTRPILLTAATTIAGLMPLVFSESTLWPPMAVAMISGLFLATLLTLFVVPALYRLLFRDRNPEKPSSDGPCRQAPEEPRAGKSISNDDLSGGERAGDGEPSATETSAGHTLPSFRMALRKGRLGTTLFFSAIGLFSAFNATSALAEEPANLPERFDLSAYLERDSSGVDLATIRDEALRYSPSLRAAEQAVRRAEAGVRSARVSLFPQITLEAQYTRITNIDNDALVAGPPQSEIDAANDLVKGVDDPGAQSLFGQLLAEQANLYGTSIAVPQNRYRLGAAVNYPLTEVFLTILPALQAATANVEVQEATGETVRAETWLRVQQTFFEVIRARSLQAVAMHRVRQTQVSLQDAEIRRDHGALSTPDFERIRARSASARAELAHTGAGVAAAEAALESLTGRDDLAERAFRFDLEAEAPPAAGLQFLIEDAMQKRPEVEAFEAAIRAVRSNRAREVGRRYPSVALTAGVDYSNPNEFFVPQRERFDATWYAGVHARWSPSDLATSLAQAELLDAESLRQSFELDGFRDEIRREVITSRAAYESARIAQIESRIAVRAAEVAYSAQVARFRVGDATVSNLLDADSEVTLARVAYIDASASVQIQGVRLERAVGGAL
ncbi:MAG: efflux RND transporter permease subunit, partial [Myxococcota bacterium]